MSHTHRRCIICENHLSSLPWLKLENSLRLSVAAQRSVCPRSSCLVLALNMVYRGPSAVHRGLPSRVPTVDAEAQTNVEQGLRDENGQPVGPVQPAQLTFNFFHVEVHNHGAADNVPVHARAQDDAAAPQDETTAVASQDDAAPPQDDAAVQTTPVAHATSAVQTTEVMPPIARPLRVDIPPRPRNWPQGFVPPPPPRREERFTVISYKYMMKGVHTGTLYVEDHPFQGILPYRRVAWASARTGRMTQWQGSYCYCRNCRVVHCFFDYEGVDPTDKFVNLASLRGQPAGVFNGIDYESRPIVMKLLGEYEWRPSEGRYVETLFDVFV